MMMAFGFSALFMGFLLAAAICDLRDLRIPNALCLAMAALGPVAVVLAIPTEGALRGALLAGVATLAVTWTMFELGWFGGGDAKLAAAAALWLGGPATLAFALATAIFGAVLAAVLLVLSRWDGARATLGPAWRERLGAARLQVPYAVGMAPGGLVALSVRFDGLY